MPEALRSGAMRLFSRLLMLIGGAMLAMAGFAFNEGQPEVIQGFALGAGAALVFGAAGFFASRNSSEQLSASGALTVMLGFWAVIPAFGAIPLHIAFPTMGYSAAYFEMVSGFTTTGATMFSDLESAPAALLFWRSLTGWLGGLFMLAAGLAILAPLRLGGFEMTHYAGGEEGGDAMMAELSRRGAERRLMRSAGLIAPPMVGVTFFGALLIAATGMPFFDALCHAMGAISTTGFSTKSAGLAAFDARFAEAGLLILCVLGAIGAPAHAALLKGRRRAWLEDRETRLLFVGPVLVTALLFGRHWAGAYEVSSTDEAENALSALWGMFFTALSFATTTGFESTDWDGARRWSALPTPAAPLLVLVMIGGAAASTAGGVKIARALVLARHGVAELERLAHPSEARPILIHGSRAPQEAVRLVWLFCMLFVMALSTMALLLAALGVDWDRALVAAVAAIVNAGPVFPVFVEEPNAYRDLPEAARPLLCVAMILGRMEILAIIALLNPGLWRR